MNHQTYFCSVCNKIWILNNSCDLHSNHLCPDIDCLGTDIHPIDEQMAPIIKILNELGYKTRNCCSNHSYEVMKCSVDYWNRDELISTMRDPILTGYIQFKECYDFNGVGDVPSGWFLEYDYYKDYQQIEDLEKPGYYMCLRMKPDQKNKDYIGSQYHINLRMNSLIRWVLLLKPMKDIMSNEQVDEFTSKIPHQSFKIYRH